MKECGRGSISSGSFLVNREDLQPASGEDRRPLLFLCTPCLDSGFGDSRVRVCKIGEDFGEEVEDE